MGSFITCIIYEEMRNATWDRDERIILKNEIRK
jgi:hypothetical protein